MNFDGFDQLIIHGSSLLGKTKIRDAHDSFHNWVNSVRDWLQGEFPNSGLSAEWSSLGTSKLIIGGVSNSYDTDRWNHFIQIVEKRMEWLSQLRSASYSLQNNILGRNDMPSIFLCHSSKDKFFVRKLADQLRQYGVKVWLDEAELQIGDSLIGKIGQAIVDVDYVGVVLSENSIQSEWVQRELNLAIQKEFAEKKVVVLPLLLESVELPPFLTDKIYADFTSSEKFDDTFPALLRSIGIPEEEIPLGNPPEDGPFDIPKITPADRKLADFEDLAIIDIDLTRSTKPESDKLLYNMYLKLSNTPPDEWREIFEAERRFPRHTMWRRAWIGGQYIIIHCVPDELEKYHMRDLRQDVQNSNNKYRKFLMESAREEIKEISEEEDESKRLRELKRSLGFD